MAEYIEREALLARCKEIADNDWNKKAAPVCWSDAYLHFADDVDAEPAADVVEVCRCGECIYYHKAHVLCNDGTEKDFSEFPPEAFGLIGCGVTAAYGINVGGKCEIEKNAGYAEDKSVFRRPNDFCSYGKRWE